MNRTRQKWIVLACGLLIGLVCSCQSAPQPAANAERTMPENPECMDGQTVDAEDGCNHCQCMDGAWQCTELDCGQGDLFGPAKPLPQAPLKRECQEGEKKNHEDGCNTCVCRVGRWVCTLKQCLPKLKPTTPLAKPTH